MERLKAILEDNLTSTGLSPHRDIKVLAMTCFWSRRNFSAIIRYQGKRYYCYAMDKGVAVEPDRG